MTEARVLTLDDLDAFFAKSPAAVPKAKATTKALPKAPVKPTLPKFWIPDAVVLWESQYTCACGCTGPATPELFVRERQDRNTRLRAIRSANQYSLLPRFLETAEPSHVTACPACFAGGAEYAAQQLTLPFPEEIAEFRSSVTKAISETLDFDKLFATIEDFQSVPKATKRQSRETPNPVGYEFVPCEVEFDTSRDHSSSMRSIYTFGVATDEGPGFPQCSHRYVSL
jgi:hypothetical protein